jgi:hypothetical protein
MHSADWSSDPADSPELSDRIAAHPEVRKLRHDIMGRLNAMTLIATLLPVVQADEALEYLSTISPHADELIALLDQVEAVIESLRSSGERA